MSGPEFFVAAVEQRSGDDGLITVRALDSLDIISGYTDVYIKAVRVLALP
jgi:hypothetical protein